MMSYAKSGGDSNRIDNASGVYMAITHSLRGEGFNASEDGTGRGTPLVPVAFDMRGREGGAQFEGPHDTANICAGSGGSSRRYVAHQWAVRRLTPLECIRLQGFPDDYFSSARLNKPLADGPIFKMLGNSMAVNVMRYMGERIEAVEESGRLGRLAPSVVALPPMGERGISQ